MFRFKQLPVKWPGVQSGCGKYKGLALGTAVRSSSEQLHLPEFSTVK